MEEKIDCISEYISDIKAKIEATGEYSEEDRRKLKGDRLSASAKPYTTP
jgi:hypothetical protein